MDYILLTNDEVLQHHGILGMKWGIRRYQNVDGSLTDAGRKRLGRLESKYEKVKIKADQYKANKIANDVAAGRALDRYKEKQGEAVLRFAGNVSAAGAAAVVGGILGGPFGATVSGSATLLWNSPKTIKAAIQAAYNKIQYKKYDELRKSSEEAEKIKSEIDELKNKDSEANKINGLSKEEYEHKRNSFKTDEEKDTWERNMSEQNNNNSSIIKHKPTPKDYKSPNNGKYDMNFLESIQNSKIDHDNNIKAIDDEYEIYKKDPDEYFKKRSKMLETV